MPSMLEAALAYAKKGWRIFPCHTPLTTGDNPTCSCRTASCSAIGKHPRTRNGAIDATTDATKITQWWTMWPDANIGFLPGSANLLAFDLDSDDSITAARKLGLFAEPTFEVATGKGVHRYYQHPPLASGAPIDGIVVRSTHGYVLLPPSLHANGKRYQVADDSPPIPLPHLAVARIGVATSKAGARGRVHHAITSEQIAPGERHHALLSIAGSLAAQRVPVDTAIQLVRSHNAARCNPPKPDAEVDDIVRYAYEQEQGKHAEVARHLLIATAAKPAVVRSEPKRANPLDQPLPGILETITQYALRTAPHPVRTYAAIAALGIGSTVCARRFKTSSQNYSTLYFIAVGTSGTGKEHVRRTVNTIFRAANTSHLIGPNEWTSRSAVWSSVLEQPQFCAVIDEFGQFLGAATGGSDGATMKNGVLTALMELFSRVDDFAITPQFSTLALSQKQTTAAKRKHIERPAPTVIGLTTPDEWYEALKGHRISSGFLNRYLVFEASVPRGDMADITDVDPPDEITAWVQAILAPRGDLDLPNRVDAIPAPRLLQIDPKATDAFRAFKRECNARADLLDAERLGELPMRAAEQAMRLALIAALACDPHAVSVSLDHAEWAIRVASYQLQQLIPAVQERVSESPVHALRNRLLGALRHAGERGLTQRELARHPAFRGTSKRDRDETIQWVQEAGYAGWGDVSQGKSGRPRIALVSVNIVNEEAA